MLRAPVSRAFRQINCAPLISAKVKNFRAPASRTGLTYKFLEPSLASISELKIVLLSSGSILPSPRRLPRRLLHGSNVTLRKLSPQITCPQSRGDGCQVPEIRATPRLHARIRKDRSGGQGVCAARWTG